MYHLATPYKQLNSFFVPDAFAEMDLNGDGLIDRDEFLRCGLGFFFYIDEDRYNHHYGVMDDSTMLVLDKDINPYKN